MSNIKNMQMWKDICADARICVSKSLFGLKTKVVYQPTDSVVDARTVECSQQDGDRLYSMFTASREEQLSIVENFRPKEVRNGNYMLEVAISRDGLFVALLLNKFQRMSYEPVTTTLLFEGKDALLVSKMFK